MSQNTKPGTELEYVIVRRNPEHKKPAILEIRVCTCLRLLAFSSRLISHRYYNLFRTTPLLIAGIQCVGFWADAIVSRNHDRSDHVEKRIGFRNSEYVQIADIRFGRCISLTWAFFDHLVVQNSNNVSIKNYFLGHVHQQIGRFEKHSRIWDHLDRRRCPRYPSNLHKHRTNH